MREFYRTVGTSDHDGHRNRYRIAALFTFEESNRSRQSDGKGHGRKPVVMLGGILECINVLEQKLNFLGQQVSKLESPKIIVP